jgi:hypothetical protein
VHESKFLSENLALYSLEKKPPYLFVFDRARTALVKRLASELTLQLASPSIEKAAAI